MWHDSSRHSLNSTTSHIWTSSFTRVNMSWRTCNCVRTSQSGSIMSHMWTSHFTHMNESFHTYKRVLSQIWTNNVATVYTLWSRCLHTVYTLFTQNLFTCVKWLFHVWHDAFRLWRDSKSYVWRDTSLRMTRVWLIHITYMNAAHIWMCHGTLCGTHMNESCHTCVWVICVTWLVHANDFSYRLGATLMSRTWLTHMCDMTRSYVWRNSYTSVTWFIHVRAAKCDMTHSCVCRIHMSKTTPSYYSCIWMAFVNSCSSCENSCSRSHVWIHGARTDQSCDTYEWDMS